MPGNEEVNSDEGEKDTSTDSATALCPHCIEPVQKFDHFCPKCGGPITSHASTDPVGQVYAAGRAYQRSTTEKSPFIVVLGIWLIFAPQIPVLLYALIEMSRITFAAPETYTFFENGILYTTQAPSNKSGIEWLQLTVIVALIAVYVAILWKVTRRHLESKRNA